MKKICVFGLFILIIMTAYIFTGCADKNTTKKTESSVSTVSVQINSDSDVSDEQNSNVEIDEADIADPFGE